MHAAPVPARTSGARAAAPIRRREGRRAARAADLATTSRIRQLLHVLHGNPLLPRPPRCRSGRDRARPRSPRRRFSPRGRPPRRRRLRIFDLSVRTSFTLHQLPTASRGRCCFLHLHSSSAPLTASTSSCAPARLLRRWRCRPARRDPRAASRDAVPARVDPPGGPAWSPRPPPSSAGFAATRRRTPLPPRAPLATARRERCSALNSCLKPTRASRPCPSTCTSLTSYSSLPPSSAPRAARPAAQQDCPRGRGGRRPSHATAPSTTPSTLPQSRHTPFPHPPRARARPLRRAWGRRASRESPSAWSRSCRHGNGGESVGDGEGRSSL